MMSDESYDSEVLKCFPNQISLLMEEKSEIKNIVREIEVKSRIEKDKLKKELKQTKQNLKVAEVKMQILFDNLSIGRHTTFPVNM